MAERSHQSLSSPSRYSPSEECILSKSASNCSWVPGPCTPPLPHVEVGTAASTGSSRDQQSPTRCTEAMSRSWVITCVQHVRELALQRRPIMHVCMAVAVCTAAVSALILPPSANVFNALISGCTPALQAHLRKLGLQQYAATLCSKGYNRLPDLLHLSDLQCVP